MEGWWWRRGGGVLHMCMCAHSRVEKLVWLVSQVGVACVGIAGGWHCVDNITLITPPPLLLLVVALCVSCVCWAGAEAAASGSAS